MNRLVLAAFSAALATACGPANGPAAYANDFKTSSGFFTQMTNAVDNSGIDADKFVHKLQRTWYSSNVRGALGGNDLPVGTVAIKETYSAPGMASGHYVMIKKSMDTWTYGVRAVDGTVMMGAPAGDNVAMCHGCHTAFASTDYLGATALKN